MATPLAQTIVDEERDRLIAEHASDDPALNNLQLEDFVAAFATDTVDSSSANGPTIMPIQFNKELSGSFTAFQNSSKVPGISLSLTKGFTTGISLTGAFPTPRGSAILALAGSSHGPAPQSPIVSEWSTWVLAPNRTGGDLLTELEALRKHTTEGLYTTEVRNNLIYYLYVTGKIERKF